MNPLPLLPGAQHNPSSAMLNSLSIVFCCLLVLELTVVFFTFPETFGYTLEETAQAFGDGALHTDHATTLKNADDAEVAHVDNKSTAQEKREIASTQ